MPFAISSRISTTSIVDCAPRRRPIPRRVDSNGSGKPRTDPPFDLSPRPGFRSDLLSRKIRGGLAKNGQLVDSLSWFEAQEAQPSSSSHLQSWFRCRVGPQDMANELSPEAFNRRDLDIGSRV